MARIYQITPRARIEKEILRHSNWCSKECSSFSPTKYRKVRLEQNLSHQDIINNKSLVHDD